MSQSIDWAYWLKLPEVKAFEAIALLYNTEPTGRPPETDDASPEYHKALRLLLACLSDRSTFTPGTLNMGDPALHGVRLHEVGAWALANDFELPEKFPRLERLVKAQSRSTPEPLAIDWPFWKAMRTVKLWQACALMVGLDPDRLKHHPQGWMAGPGSGPVFDSRSFSSAQAKDRLDKAMRLAATAVSYMEGPIFPKGTPAPGSKGDKDVALSEVVAFFRSCEWPDIPEPLQSVAIPAAPVEMQASDTAKVPKMVAPMPKQRAQEQRILQLLNAQGYTPQALTQRAPGKPGPKAEIRSLAMNEKNTFSTKTFDTAWQRLRDSGEIGGAE